MQTVPAGMDNFESPNTWMGGHFLDAIPSILASLIATLLYLHVCC